MKRAKRALMEYILTTENLTKIYGKHKAADLAMVVGAILGIGVTNLVYIAANGLLGMLKITVDIAKIMPYGINGLISVSNLGNIAVRSIIVAIVFIAGFLTSAVLLFKKRDIK